MGGRRRTQTRVSCQHPLCPASPRLGEGAPKSNTPTDMVKKVPGRAARPWRGLVWAGTPPSPALHHMEEVTESRSDGVTVGTAGSPLAMQFAKKASSEHWKRIKGMDIPRKRTKRRVIFLLWTPSMHALQASCGRNE